MVAKAKVGHVRADLGDQTVTAMQAVATQFQQWLTESQRSQSVDFHAMFGSHEVCHASVVCMYILMLKMHSVVICIIQHNSIISGCFYWLRTL